MPHTDAGRAPRARPTAAASPVTATGMPVVTVLVVDDDEDTRDVLHLALEGEGYAVTEAPDGERTLDALRASATGMVVVLDLDLPRLDGIGVLWAAARDKRLAGRHAFMLLTAVSTVRAQAAEVVCGELAVPFMRKPFEMDDFLDVVAGAARSLSARAAGPGR